MELKGVNIAVVGAGIGGLAAALALSRIGARVTVYEQAEALTEIGAGLQISANGMAVLRELGIVTQGMEHAGLRSGGTIVRDYRKGVQVTEMPPPVAGPTYYFHRADLIALLHDAVCESGVTIVTGARVSGYVADADRPGIEMADGQMVQADLVIAADGGRSQLRRWLVGAETPKFTKQVAWRATVDGAQIAHPDKAVLTMGPGRHMVTYPLREGRLINIVAVEERSDWRDEGWRQAGDPDDLGQRFGEFGGEAEALLAAVQETYLWALFLRPVSPIWQNGHLALLGDAAHPTLPFMAQGACLSLEDAWVLARSLVEAEECAQGLAIYERRRQDRARGVVAAAGANARKFHMRGPARKIAQLGLAFLGPRIARSYEWVYGHDVTRLYQAVSSTQTGT